MYNVLVNMGDQHNYGNLEKGVTRDKNYVLN